MPLTSFFQPIVQLACFVALSEGQRSWCQSEPGSCVGRRQRFKEPNEIELVDSEVARIHRVWAFLNWDGDGDQDIVATYYDQVLSPEGYRRNGLCCLGLFEQLANGSFVIHELLKEYIDTLRTEDDLAYHLDVAAADWDADGQVDVLIAADVGEGRVVGWANRSTAMGHGEVKSLKILFDDHMPKGRMQAVDWDRDTHLIFGGRYFKRADLNTVTELVGDQNPLGQFVKEGVISKDSKDIQFQIADMDGDGYLEMVMSAPGRWQHAIRYFRSAMGGAFVEQTEHAFQGIWLGSGEAARMADWNSDGMTDMLVFGYNDLKYYEAIQDGDLAEDHHTAYGDIKIAQGDCSDLQLYSNNIRSRNGLHVFDWNSDGFPDVLKYCKGQLQLFEFRGQHMVEVFGVFDNVTALQNNSCSLTASDWDGDGDVDLLIVSQSGEMHYHEMVG